MQELTAPPRPIVGRLQVHLYGFLLKLLLYVSSVASLTL